MNQKPSLRRQLIKSFMGVGAMKLSALPMNLLVSVLLARSLGPQSFGQYAFVFSLVQLIALPVSGGVPQLITREVATYAYEKTWGLYRGLLVSAHFWVIVVSILIVSAFYLLKTITPGVLDNGHWTLMSIAIFLVPLLGLNAVRNGFIKGLGFPMFAELPVQFLLPTFLLACVAAAYFLGVLTSESALWIQLGAYSLTFIASISLFIKVSPVRKDNDAEYRVESWLVALLPFSLIALVSTFNTQIGIVLLGFLGTDEEVAGMRIAERGAQFVALSLIIVNLIIAPHIVRAIKEGNRKKLQKLAQYSSRGAFLIALPIALVFIFFGEMLVGLVFGEQYRAVAYPALKILAIGQLINVFFGSVGVLLSMSGLERKVILGQILGIGFNIGFCLILIPSYGAEGAALAITMGMVVWNIVLSWFVMDNLKIRAIPV